MMYKVALWGIGEGYNIFTSLRGHDLVEVVALTDNETRSITSIDGIPVICPKDLIEYSYDYLIVSVMNDRIYKEIVKEAEEMGIDRSIILPLRIFQIPFFNFEDYIKIKESNISILSDYCFAGFLYHKFGMKFTSPTINMYANNENFYRFISDLDKYMNTPMVEVENAIDQPYLGCFAYPRGRIDDVEWEFNHDPLYETAAARWKKGVERFNWDNYIVVMSIRSDQMARQFNELPIEHKMGFYWKDLGLDSVICMPEWKTPSIRQKYGFDFARLANRVADEAGGIRTVNWMKALLHEDGYSRVK